MPSGNSPRVAMMARSIGEARARVLIEAFCDRMVARREEEAA